MKYFKVMLFIIILTTLNSYIAYSIGWTPNNIGFWAISMPIAFFVGWKAETIILWFAKELNNEY